MSCEIAEIAEIAENREVAPSFLSRIWDIAAIAENRAPSHQKIPWALKPTTLSYLSITVIVLMSKSIEKNISYCCY